MLILNREETRLLEDRAAACGTPHAQLMENAGTAAFDYVKKHFAGALCKGTSVLLCGNGNNGGDGFVLARRLAQAGVETLLVYVQGAPKTPDAQANEKITKGMKLKYLDWNRSGPAVERELERAAVIFDCVFGNGFHGELPGPVAALFACCNRSPALRIALDIPSGAACKKEEPAFLADITLSFTALKPEQVSLPGRSRCGRVEVLPIGIPEEVLQSAPHQGELLEYGQVRAMLPPRQRESNKGSYGKALCVCGSYGMAGAAALALTGACRCGAGLVVAVMPKSIYPILAQQLPEPVMVPVAEASGGTFSNEAQGEILNRLASSSACLVGCGMGKGAAVDSLTCAVLENARIPLVLDADGINAVAKHIDKLKTAKAPVILTPHPGEMARLIGCTVEAVQQNRLETARRFARAQQVIVVLKGYQTVIALPDGRYYVNPTGNAGMAKGGSGDFLAGMVVSFLAQGIPPAKAACAGVYLHGLAGDRAAEQFSKRAMLPSDLAKVLPALFLEMEK